MPIICFDSLQSLLAITAVQDWRPLQFDVYRSFLDRYLEEKIYMRLPKGSRDQGKIIQLPKFT
jgi:hypothetical protein